MLFLIKHITSKLSIFYSLVNQWSTIKKADREVCTQCVVTSLLLLVYLYCKRLESVKLLQSFPRKSSQTTRTKQTASWGVPVSVICDWLVLHGTFEKFNDGHTIEYIFDWLYFNKAYLSNNNYGHVIHFYWKIYNDNGTKGFVLEKKNERTIMISDYIYTFTLLTYRTAIDLNWLRANYYTALFKAG